MKRFLFTTLLLLTLCSSLWSQEPSKFTPEQQIFIDLSNNKWAWMAEKNVEQLEKLFHESAQFVHMGGYWGKEEELRTIKEGGIWYKKAEIHSQEVHFASGIATVYSRIHLNSVVGGHDVRFPFFVTEVFVFSDGRWQLSSLVFTKTLGE